MRQGWKLFTVLAALALVQAVGLAVPRLADAVLRLSPGTTCLGLSCVSLSSSSMTNPGGMDFDMIFDRLGNLASVEITLFEGRIFDSIVANNTTNVEIFSLFTSPSAQYAGIIVDIPTMTRETISQTVTTNNLALFNQAWSRIWASGGPIVYVPGATGALRSLTVPPSEPNVVPEPATLTLLGSGLLGLAAAGRKRRAKKNESV